MQHANQGAAPDLNGSGLRIIWHGMSVTAAEALPDGTIRVSLCLDGLDSL